MRKAEILAELYKALWLSADFESCFEADWRAVYNVLLQGDPKSLPEPVLKCCYKYLLEWRENENASD